MTQELIIKTLARQVHNKEKNVVTGCIVRTNDAALTLEGLTNIPVSLAWDMINNEVKRLKVLRELHKELIEEKEDRDNQRYDANHTSELASRWAE